MKELEIDRDHQFDDLVKKRQKDYRETLVKGLKVDISISKQTDNWDFRKKLKDCISKEKLNGEKSRVPLKL